MDGLAISLNRHGGAVGFQEVGVLVRVGSAHPVVQGAAGWGLVVPAWAAPVPCGCPSLTAPVGERRAAVDVAAGDGLGR